jgi:drug/metabolite transporter (DMT)-like permease
VGFEWMPTVYGLIAAITWGAGDFSGGIATRRTNAYSVVIVAHTASILLLIVTAMILHDPNMPLKGWLWGGAAGLCGGFGLMLLYSSLAIGRMAVAAPVSALVAAGIPVIITGLSDGLPGIIVLSGFILALIAIWLISGGGSTNFNLSDLRLPITAGVAFGFFFLCLHQASSSSVLFPLIAVRVVSISSLLIYAFISRQSIIPTRNSVVPILLSGLLDTIGNSAFALAAQLGRVDVAAVLSSLYPGSTVLLAWIFLHERINRKQAIGILVALLAIILITI